MPGSTGKRAVKAMDGRVDGLPAVRAELPYAALMLDTPHNSWATSY